MPGRPDIAWDDPAARDQLVTTLVNDALSVLAGLEGAELSDAQSEAVALLALVAGQDVEPAEDSDGTDGRWQIARKVAPDRVISTVDPETRHAHKSREADRRVTCYYFYIWDEDFGPSFIKVCAYFPYPVKVWLNGHEWAKRQATHAGIGFTELSNGFATCEDPAALQAICDRLGPGTITVFFERWMSVLPLPLNPADRSAGYWWELSMRQVETSRTIVFDAPRRARAFFEALVADNLDIGRPDRVEVIFAGHPRRWGRPPKVEPTYKTRIATRETIGVTVNADFKHSRIKQYLKDGRALRIETVINTPDDLGCKRRLQHLDELQAKARAVNTRLLDTERVGQGCVLASPAFERVAQSTLTEDGRRSPALRFGDPRVMAPLGALCIGLNALGFTNRSLRAQVSHLLGISPDAYTRNRASYDLARLRLKGLIRR